MPPKGYRRGSDGKYYPSKALDKLDKNIDDTLKPFREATITTHKLKLSPIKLRNVDVAPDYQLTIKPATSVDLTKFLIKTKLIYFGLGWLISSIVWIGVLIW